SGCASPPATSPPQPERDTKSQTSRAEKAPIGVKRAPTQASSPTPEPEASGMSVQDRLERLLTKEPGTADESVVDSNPNEVDVLRGVCERVVLSERGSLACEGCP